MKAKNVKVGVGVVIKECAVGYARNHIGKRGVIVVFLSDITCYVDVGGVSVLVYHAEIRKMKSSDLDEAPIVYTHPMQEHLGKEVVEKYNGRRGWVVGHTDAVGSNALLIDFGVHYKGHCGTATSSNPYYRATCGWRPIENLQFLTEDEE
jgi:hypothetical protein